MSLTLVTGPANAAKAAVVLDRYRAALARAPLLVVPRAADVEHYRRELAESDVVLGAAVESFGGLLREIARRVGLTERPLGEHARRRVLERVTGSARLDLLARAARTPGFVPALARFVAELESRRVAPGRLAAALRAWAPAPDSRRRRYAEELSSLYGGYRAALGRLGRLDAELAAVAALDALRLEPARWSGTPIFCYGFDDLEPLQLDAIETLAHRVGVPVVLSLPGEPGRVALAGRAATLETLRPAAEEIVELPPLDAHYEDAALHHLERSLFEDGPARIAPAGAVRLLQGGDERAEAELIATEIAELVASGCDPGDIAVVTRGPARVAVLIARALGEAGVPFAQARRERFSDTGLGGGLLALLRAASGHGDGADLVRWLRVPGVVATTALVDRFEAGLMRRGSGPLEAARAEWEGEHWPLDAIERLRAAGRDGPVRMLERVETELDAMLAAPSRRAAALLGAWPAATVTAARRALRELRELALSGGSGYAIDLDGIVATLADLVVELPPPASRDAVVIGDALELRARRVRALFVAGVQEDAFPSAGREPPFLSGAERAELARASGLVLEAPVDALAAERSLFYALCSRPTAWLRISWHDGTDDDAGAALRSLFIDDLADCFDDSLEACRRIRAAGAVGWQGATAAPARLVALGATLAGPRRRGPVIGPAVAPGLLSALRGHPAYSPSALELWAGCPVNWFVERALRAEPLEPENVPRLRGTVAHETLRTVFRDLVARTGSARLNEESLPVALAALGAALDAEQAPLSPRQPVARAEARRLRRDLRRYLEFAATGGGGRFEPREFELAFGLPGDELGPVDLGGVEVCGRVDRVDVDTAGREAIVVDYKTGAVEPVARWSATRRLQPALYMLAVERLLGVEAVGGLYQPLRSPDLRPRGAVRVDVDAGVELVDNDRRDAGDLRELLFAQLAVALAAAGEIAAGELRPRPQTCSSQGRCRHPAICRCEAR